MKKFLMIFLSFGILFAANNTEIDKKLNELILKVNTLTKKVEENGAEIKSLKKRLNIQQKQITTSNKKVEKKIETQLAVKSCKKISVSDFSDQYYGGIIPYYYLNYTLKNNYPKKIVYLVGDLFVEDSSGVKILQDFIERKVDMASGGSIVIHKKHLLNGELEKYLKDADLKKVKIYFTVIKAKFADGSDLECGGI